MASKEQKSRRGRFPLHPHVHIPGPPSDVVILTAAHKTLKGQPWTRFLCFAIALKEFFPGSRHTLESFPSFPSKDFLCLSH